MLLLNIEAFFLTKKVFIIFFNLEMHSEIQFITARWVSHVFTYLSVCFLVKLLYILKRHQLKLGWEMEMETKYDHMHFLRQIICIKLHLRLVEPFWTLLREIPNAPDIKYNRFTLNSNCKTWLSLFGPFLIQLLKMRPKIRERWKGWSSS
jgi:hypothetical protein